MKRLLIALICIAGITSVSSAALLFQRPTPNVVGGATSAGVPVAFVADSDGYIQTESNFETNGLGVSISVNAATTTLIVSGTASQHVRVGAYAVSLLTTTGTVTWVSGTGVNCGTGTTNLSGAIPLTAGNPLPLGSGIAPVLRTAATGDNLCLAATGGNALGHLFYAKY